MGGVSATRTRCAWSSWASPPTPTREASVRRRRHSTDYVDPMLRVGLTGGIGSGKSTVARSLADLGAVVVDADAVAREVVEPGMPALSAIRDRFGDTVFGADGALDRPALGRVVFGDPKALADLEGITHPAIWRRTADLLAAAPADAILVHDMPLIVE